MRFRNIASLFCLCLILAGCAGFGKKLKGFLNGRDLSEQDEMQKPSYTKFSDNSTMANPTRRQYRRTTKQSLSEEAQLDNRAGSLWVMEGQGSYLFSQNIIRMIGDSLPVKVDGEPRDQLQTKVNVIRKLLAKMEQKNIPPPISPRTPAGSPPGGTTVPPAAAKTGDQEPAAKSAEASKPDTNQGNEAFPVQTVPTRITERLIDGNYRVRGTQPFMIGPREYKVIVTGIVRAEDFSDAGISSTKLLDSKYDIMSVKRKDE
jgi:flagellar L-ring protein precursor FlgH